MRFPMTLDRVTRGITIGAVLLIALILPVQAVVTLQKAPPPLGVPLSIVFGVVGATLLLGLAWAPRAVKVGRDTLLVERLGWTPYEQRLDEVTGVEDGPAIELRGPVRRVAGNGGLMGYSGLYHLAGVGLVRLWATRLGTPTVLLRRGDERPLLLGVDDPAALKAALLRARPRLAS